MMKLTKSVHFLSSQYIKLTNYPGKFDQVAKLELDNPKKKNALSIDLLAQV